MTDYAPSPLISEFNFYKFIIQIVFDSDSGIF